MSHQPPEDTGYVQWIVPSENIMFDREEFLRWNTLFGPVSVDACADDQGQVAQTTEFFCPKRSFLGSDVSGQCVWLNPPFDRMKEFLSHMCKCRDMAPSSTRALIVVPKWEQEPWYSMLRGCTLLHEYPSGTELFTYLNVTGEREPAGPCPWPVQLWAMGDFSSQKSPVPSAQFGRQVHVAVMQQCDLVPAGGKIPSWEQDKSRKGSVKALEPRNLSYARTDRSLHSSLIPAGSSISSWEFDRVVYGSRGTSEFHYLNQAQDASTEGYLHERCAVLTEQAARLFEFPGLVHQKTVNLLLDSGATTEFINRRVVDELALHVSSGPQMRVRLADGNFTTSSLYVDVPWSVQEYSDSIRCLVLNLDDSYQLILGRTWLVSRNPAINWAEGTMIINGKELKALSVSAAPAIAILSAKSMRKKWKKRGKEDCFFLGILSEYDPESPDFPHTLEPDLKEWSSVVEQIDQIQSEITPDWDEKLKRLLKSNPGVFLRPSTIPDQSHGTMRIRLVEGAQPPPPKMYRLSVSETKEMEKQIKDLLAKGWISPSSSPFGAPILFVKKADGSLRMCVDYRGLNAITVKDTFPIPRIEELVDHMQGCRWFTSLDLVQAYYQIPIEESDTYKTAFRTQMGSFEFKVMPFGLSNAPSVFQRIMCNLLSEYLYKFVVIYLDDICVYSRNADEHLDHVSKVIQRLSDAKFVLRPDKCKFGRASLRYLGLVIDKDGLRPSQDKVQAVLAWPKPKTVTQIRQFLGFVGFYRKFIRMFSDIAKPLIKLTKADCSEAWGPDQDESFQKLKQALVEAPCLIIPKAGPDAHFVVATDASNKALGAVLMQDQGNGLQPIAYMARVLNPAQQKYATHDQELLAVVEAVRYFRNYLEDCKRFTVVTDHDTLKYFLTQQQLSKLQARWAVCLQPYRLKMDILYRRGDKNQADSLSRRPDLQEQAEQLWKREAEDLWQQYKAARDQVQNVSLLQTSQLVIDSDLLQQVREAQSLDPWCRDPKSGLVLGEDSLWRKQGKLYIPQSQSLRTQILKELHDVPYAGHVGSSRMLAALKRNFWWPHMSRYVERYVNSCPTCQRMKPTPSDCTSLYRHNVPQYPWEVVSMDLIVSLPQSHGYDSVVVFVDRFSKMVHLAPTVQTVTAQELAIVYLNSVFRLHGISLKLISDRDPRFVSQFWQSLFTELGTSLNLSTSYHPQTDGQTERINQVVEQTLRTCVNHFGDDWVKFLAVTEFALNSAVSRTTGSCPFEVVYGFVPTTPVSLLNPSTQTQSIHDKMIQIRDLVKVNLELVTNPDVSIPQFQVGDKVKLDTSNLVLRGKSCFKFKERWVGPFKIERKISPTSYKLELPQSFRCHPVFHFSKLRKWKEAPEFRGEGAEHDCSAREESYPSSPAIKKVRNVKVGPHPSRRNGDCLLFLVSYQGQGPRQDSWEPYQALKRLQALDEFLETRVWSQFRNSKAYQDLKQRFPSRVPQ